MPSQNDNDGQRGHRCGGVKPDSDWEDLVRQGQDRLRQNAFLALPEEIKGHYENRTGGSAH